MSQRGVQARPLSPSLFVCWPLGLTLIDLQYSDGMCWDLVAFSGRIVILLKRVVTSNSGYLNGYAS
jgi:hypothetical protein